MEQRDLRDLGDVFDRARPVLVTGAKWPALTRWTSEHLVERLGASRPVSVFRAKPETRGFLSGPSQAREASTFGEAVARVFGAGEQPEEYLYLWPSGSGAWEFLEGVREELSPPPSAGGRAFLPAASGLWVGQRGTTTLVHTDVVHGLLGESVGRKRVSLFAPDARWRTQVTTFLQQMRGRTDETSRVQRRRELFQELARESPPLEVALGPGEVLYIPPFWWHEVESLDHTISFSLRYAMIPRDLVRSPAAWGSAAYSAVEHVMIEHLPKLLRRLPRRRGAR